MLAGYLTTWGLREYLGELAGREVELPAVPEVWATTKSEQS